MVKKKAHEKQIEAFHGNYVDDSLNKKHFFFAALQFHLYGPRGKSSYCKLQ